MSACGQTAGNSDLDHLNTKLYAYLRSSLPTDALYVLYWNTNVSIGTLLTLSSCKTSNAMLLIWSGAVSGIHLIYVVWTKSIFGGVRMAFVNFML